MVSLREILGDLARVLVTLLTWLYCIPLALFVVLWILIGDRVWPLSVIGNFLPYLFVPVMVLLPLGLLTRAWRGLRFSLPLAVLALVVYGRLFLPHLPVAAAAESLRVVTLNVNQFNRNVSQIEDWLRQQHPDVAFLQEVPISALLPITYQMGADYRYMNVYQPTEEKFASILLSQFPLVDDYELETGSRVYSLLRYAIRWNGQLVALYGVDTAPPLGDKRFDLPLMNGRVGQYVLGYDPTNRDTALNNLLNVIQSESLPMIVLGDFGLSDQSSLYGQFAAVLKDSYREAGYGLGSTWPLTVTDDLRGTLPSLIPPLMRVDYIWHSDQFRASQAIVGPALGSDHLAVIAQLGWVSSP